MQRTNGIVFRVFSWQSRENLKNFAEQGKQGAWDLRGMTRRRHLKPPWATRYRINRHKRPVWLITTIPAKVKRETLGQPYPSCVRTAW